MEFALTITKATPSELSALLLALQGSTSPFAATMQTAAAAHTAATADDGTGDDAGPVNANAPAVDNTGLPWDERIHSGNKETTDKGVWRKRRGVQAALVTQVEAELRAKTAAAPQQQPVMQPQPMQQPAPVVMQMPAPQPAPVMTMQPPATGYPTGPGYPQQPGNVVMQPQPMQMPVQQPVMQPAPQQQPGVAMDFPTFMQALSGQMQKRDAAGMPLIDTDYLARITSEMGAAFGVPLGVITDMVSQPRAAEMIVYAVQCMQRDQKWN